MFPVWTYSDLVQVPPRVQLGAGPPACFSTCDTTPIALRCNAYISAIFPQPCLCLIVFTEWFLGGGQGVPQPTRRQPMRNGNARHSVGPQKTYAKLSPAFLRQPASLPAGMLEAVTSPVGPLAASTSAQRAPQRRS
eukprot:EG_transcript_29674